jgi:hypothetical protein
MIEPEAMEAHLVVDSCIQFEVVSLVYSCVLFVILIGMA